MPPITIDLSNVRMPTGSDEKMAFHTFRNYLQATCNLANYLYAHPDGLLAGVVAGDADERVHLGILDPLAEAELQERAAVPGQEDGRIEQPTQACRRLVVRVDGCDLRE